MRFGRCRTLRGEFDREARSTAFGGEVHARLDHRVHDPLQPDRAQTGRSTSHPGDDFRFSLLVAMQLASAAELQLLDVNGELGAILQQAGQDVVDGVDPCAVLGKADGLRGGVGRGFWSCRHAGNRTGWRARW